MSGAWLDRLEDWEPESLKAGSGARAGKARTTTGASTRGLSVCLGLLHSMAGSE